MKVSVLVVDDDAGFRRVATVLLGERGYQVVAHAGSGAEALAKARELQPDAVLLDVNLPDAHGSQVAHELSAYERPPRVLMISTDAEAMSHEQVAACAAAGFMAKATLATADLDCYFKR